MTTLDSEDINDLLQAIESKDLSERATAVQILGEIGDENALKVLRERLVKVNQEMSVLVVAVGKLKRKLGVS